MKRDYSFRAGQRVSVDIGEVDSLLRSHESPEKPADDENSNETRASVRSTARRPSFSGTTTSSWSKPSLSDFGISSWDDASAEEKRRVVNTTLLGEVEDTFDASYVLPVVEPSGELNANALRNAISRASQVSGISSETSESAQNMARSLLDEHFDSSSDSRASSSPSEDPLTASQESPVTVLSKIKRLLGLTNETDASHTPEVERRSSEENKDDAVETRTTETGSANATSEKETTEETESMSQKANDSKTPTRDERIAALIAAENVSFTEDDKEILANLSDDAFSRVETVAFEQAEKLAEAEKGKEELSAKLSAESDEKTDPDTNASTADDSASHATDSDQAPAARAAEKPAEQPRVIPREEKEAETPKSPEEYVAALKAPPEIKRIFERHLEQEKKHRESLISTIKANKANRLTDAALESMETDQLEAIAELAEPEADFSANGLHTHERKVKANEENREPLRMPKFGIKIGEARVSTRLASE